MSAKAPTDDPRIETAIHRVRSGDTAAFELVVRRYERPVRAWLAVRAPPGIDIDEVAQRTFVAAYSRLDEYELHSNFGAWLFTILRYQLKTETTRLRRAANNHLRHARDLVQRELDRRGAERPEAEIRRLQHLRRCVDSLTESLRRFIAWRYEDGIPLEEMAARSGRSLAAVKKQLWQLRRRLHDCVERRRATEGGAS